MNIKIPVYKPRIGIKEIEYVNKCLVDGWISSRGEFVEKFETMFAEYMRGGYSTSVSNGTVALHLALYALGIEEGDEVIVPTLTYVAPANAIRYVGATPVFIDAEIATWNIDCSRIEEKITSKTKAIIVVHLYGAVCDMSTIQDICKRHNIYIIEDTAEAFGSKYLDNFAGTFGDIATFSFYGNKTITTGEGGMIMSRNKDLINRISSLKSQAVSQNREYWHDEIGFNYRMTNIAAAIGLAQLEQAPEILEKKRQVADWYREELQDYDVVFQAESHEYQHSYWMISILLNSKIQRDATRIALSKGGVETRPFFYPAHSLPAFSVNTSFPVAELLSERGLNLPSWPDLSRNQITYLCGNIKRTLDNYI